MTFTINKDEILQLLDPVSGFMKSGEMDKDDTINPGNFIYLMPDTKGCLWLGYHSGTLEVRKKIQFYGEIPGFSICLPGKKFKDIIKTAENNIKFNILDDTRLQINCDDVIYHLDWFESSFNFNLILEGSAVTVNRADFRQAIINISPYAAFGEDAGINAGVSIKTRNNLIEFAATNGDRLGTFTIEPVGGSFIKAVVNGKILFMVQKILTKCKDLHLQIEFNDKSEYNFILDGIQIFAVGLSGDYPAYEKLIPEKFDHEFCFSAPKMTKILSSIKNTVNSKTNTCSINIEKNNIIVFADHEEVGTSASKLKPVTKINFDRELSFNLSFMLEGISPIRHIASMKISKEPNTPIIINELGKDNYTYLLMPIIDKNYQDKLQKAKKIIGE